MKISDGIKMSAVTGLLVILAIGLFAPGTFSSVSDGVMSFLDDPLSFGDDGDDPNEDPNETPTGDIVNVDDWGVDAQVKFPSSPNSADVYLYKEEPENWGNYVDWDFSVANSGLQQGVDYFSQTGVSSSPATFSELASGDYFLVVNDTNYQTAFKKVSMPEEVSEAFAENDKKITLADVADLDLAPTYGSDNQVWYDDDGNVLTTGTDLTDASNNASRTVQFVRTIDVDTGVAYLGSYDVTSFNDGDGIEDVDITVEAGDETYTMELKDGSSGELADSNSFGEDIVDAIETDPAMENQQITITLDITYTADTAVANAGDSAIGPGESLLTLGLDDIYGDDVSTATHALTG